MLDGMFYIKQIITCTLSHLFEAKHENKNTVSGVFDYTQETCRKPLDKGSPFLFVKANKVFYFDGNRHC